MFVFFLFRAQLSGPTESDWGYLRDVLIVKSLDRAGLLVQLGGMLKVNRSL